MAEAPPPQYAREREREGALKFSTKFNQGLGAVPDTIKNWIFNSFALLFYNQMLGIEAIKVSTALAIAMVFDAVTDPLVGSFSDNMRTRFGRRHPLMAIAALPLGAALYAVFVPPEGLDHDQLFWWLLTFTVLTRGLMTLYFVPWTAIAAELSDDYHERTTIMAYRYAVGWTVGVLTPVYMYTFVLVDATIDGEKVVGQLNPLAYPKMALIAGCMLSIGAIATTALTWREIPYLLQPVKPPAFSFAVAYRDLVRSLSNGQFRLIFFVVLLSSAIGGTTINIGIYMQTFFWGFSAADLRWLPLSALGAFIGFPLVAVVQRKWDKKHILVASYAVLVVDGLVLVSLRFLGILPENGDPLLLQIFILQGIVMVVLLIINGIIGSSIIADLLDDQELRTGYRQEGMFNAALSFSGKAITGVGTMLGGLIITVIDFPTGVAPDEVPADAIMRLGVVVGLMLPLLHIVPMSLLTRYQLTREKHAEIRAALDARRLEQTRPATDGPDEAA